MKFHLHKGNYMYEQDSSFINQERTYRTLKCFQKAEFIYDITYHFAHRFLSIGDRTVDQMIQAARSGKQNLAEGNIDGITSKEMELKLTNVNRASLHELLLDYEDYLRVIILTLLSTGRRFSSAVMRRLRISPSR